MNDYTRLRLQAETHKKQYPPGTRIYLERMNDQYDPVPSGTRGTVHHVDDMDNIRMRWDNHRTLLLSPDEDSFRVLTAAELNEELRRDHEIVSLGDDCEIVLPEKPIDCSDLTYFDELKYECWHLMEKYCERMGIRILDYDDGEKPISFDIAKNIQEVILDHIQGAGVKLIFDSQTEDSRMTMNGM